MQLPRPQQGSWQSSTISHGLAVIEEDESEKSSNCISGSDSNSTKEDVPEKLVQHSKSADEISINDGNTSFDRAPISVASPRAYPWTGQIQQFMDSFFNDDECTTPSVTSVYSESRSLTDKSVKLTNHISIVIGPPVILLLDLVVPCAIYYSWLNVERRKWHQNGEQGPRPMYNHYIMGLSIISFGIGEIYILLARVVRLIKDHEGCAPLLSTHWWELDATSWVYLTALLIALIPFVTSTTLSKEVIPWLYLYPPGFLMAFLACLSTITLFPFRIPIRINSDPAGSRLRPLVFYAAEDFIAVDGFQGRNFRRRFRARYDRNPRFQRLMLHLTLFWIMGICFYHALLAAMVWTVPFEYAFGISLGILFGWIATWAGLTIFWVRRIADSERAKARTRHVRLCDRDECEFKSNGQVGRDRRGCIGSFENC